MGGKTGEIASGGLKKRLTGHKGPGGAVMLAGQFAQELMQLGGPARKAYFGQLKEALTKGTLEQRTPIIQQMVERGLGEGSRAQTLTQESLAKLGPGAARTPFAKETLATQRGMAERAVAAIPSEVVSQAALRAPEDTLAASNAANAFLGTAGTAIGQAQQAAAAQQSTAIAAGGAAAGIAIAIVAAI